MAYLMDGNAMRICIRPRPWHPEKELPFLPQLVDVPLFIGDGSYAAPRKQPTTGSLREIVEVVDNRQLIFDRPEDGIGRRGMGAKRYKNRRYVFDHVFRMDTTQEDVYEHTARPLLEGVLSGFNATVFAYGATGCGKTHTISGTPEDPGIVLRTMRDLYRLVEESSSKYETRLEFTMIELYNETIRDLLSDDFPVTPHGGLKLLENEKERVTIADVTVKTPQTVDEVMELVVAGNERRSTSYTASNSASSRSHAVLQVSITRSTRTGTVDADLETVTQDTSSATLSIVDLAGSERAAATLNMGMRKTEGANINKSLLALSSCISALCAAQQRRSRPHVPYRNSKLTRLLKFSLGGNCRTVMIVCVSPSSRDLEDTSNTLTWANKAKDVKMTVTKNTGGNELAVRQYVQKISELSEMIKILEAKQGQQEGMSQAMMEKAMATAQKRVTEALSPVKTKYEQSLPSVEEGAEAHAKKDVAELTIDRLRVRLADIDEDEYRIDPVMEKAFCEEIIAHHSQMYLKNSNIAQKVQVQRDNVSAVNAQVEQLKARGMPGLDVVNVENMRLQADNTRIRLESAVLKGREKGYRWAMSSTQDKYAQAAIAMQRSNLMVSRHLAALDKLVNSGSMDHSKLRDLTIQLHQAHGLFDRERRAIFGTAIAIATDAVPPPMMSPPSTRRTSMPLLPESPAPVKAVPPSPAIKRLRDKAGFKVGALASPRRPIPPRALRPPSEPRRTRFADDVGGNLQTIHEFTRRSSQSPSSVDISVNRDDEDSAEWEELSEDSSPIRNSSTVAFMPTPPPFAVGALPKPARVEDVDSEMPEWKKNRVLMGKATVSTPSAPGTASPVVEPEQPKVGLPGLGRPTRPPRSSSVPLGQLRQIPAPRPSVSGSTLLQPTAASAARATSENLASPTPSDGHRRLSIRHEKKTRRHSKAVPYSLTGSQTLIPSPVSSTGSPRDRMVGKLPGKVGLGQPMRMRQSMLGPLSSGVANASVNGSFEEIGPKRIRHSISQNMRPPEGLGASLRARPSMPQLGASTAGQSKPQWR